MESDRVFRSAVFLTTRAADPKGGAALPGSLIESGSARTGGLATGRTSAGLRRLSGNIG